MTIIVLAMTGLIVTATRWLIPPLQDATLYNALMAASPYSPPSSAAYLAVQQHPGMSIRALVPLQAQFDLPHLRDELSRCPVPGKALAYRQFEQLYQLLG